MNTIRSRAWTHLLAGVLLCYPACSSYHSPLSRANELQSVPVGVIPYSMRGLDVNDDGSVDLIVGGLDQDAICAVAVSGDPIWRHPTEGMPMAIEIGDIDGDATSEIVAVIGTSASKILVLDRAGSLIREIQPDVVVYLLRLADVDGDNQPDIVVAGYGGKILVYNYRGRKFWTRRWSRRTSYVRWPDWGPATSTVMGAPKSRITGVCNCLV